MELCALDRLVVFPTVVFLTDVSMEFRVTIPADLIMCLALINDDNLNTEHLDTTVCNR